MLTIQIRYHFAVCGLADREDSTADELNGLLYILHEVDKCHFVPLLCANPVRVKNSHCQFFTVFDNEVAGKTDWEGLHHTGWNVPYRKKARQKVGKK